MPQNVVRLLQPLMEPGPIEACHEALRGIVPQSFLEAGHNVPQPGNLF